MPDSVDHFCNSNYSLVSIHSDEKVIVRKTNAIIPEYIYFNNQFLDTT
jgi:hypothetical protein